MPKLIFITYLNYPNKEKKKILRNLFNITKYNFDKVITWYPHLVKKEIKNSSWMIKDYEKKFSNKCKNYNIPININWLQNGCMAWKPHIILHSLKKYCNKGDILIYHDSNLIKYPIYKKNISNKKKFFFKLLKKKEIVLFKDSYRPLKEDCKTDLLNKYFFNNKNSIMELNGFWAGCLIVKNTPMGIKFINMWCKLSTLKNLCPYSKGKQFVKHAPEQSTLSILYYYKIKYLSKYINQFYAPSRKIFEKKNYQFTDIKVIIYIKLKEFFFNYYKLIKIKFFNQDKY